MIRDDDHCAGLEVVRQIVEVLEHDAGLVVGARPVAGAEEDHLRTRVRRQRKKRSEVRVARDEHAILCTSDSQHLVVLGLIEAQIGRMNDVVAGGPQQHRQPGRAILIEQEPHADGCRGISRSATASAA